MRFRTLWEGRYTLNFSTGWDVEMPNAELVQELHQQENFPGALVLKPGKSPLQKYLKFGLLRPELVAAFLWGLSQDIGADIALTGIPCRLGEAVEVVEASSCEILAESPPQRSIELEFLSPTSFKQLQSCQLFPLPELVFGSLLRRWNVFAPTALQFPAVEWTGVTAACELKTRALKMKGEQKLGRLDGRDINLRMPNRQKLLRFLLVLQCFREWGER